jgi:hypothetical protein
VLVRSALALLEHPPTTRLTLDLFVAMKKRRMHRAFAPDPVPRELMEKLVCRWASCDRRAESGN